MKIISGCLWSIVLFFVACSSSKRVNVSSLHLPDALPALPESTFDLPVKIAVKPILFKANFLLPTQFTSDGWPNYSQPTCDFRYKYRFLRSGLTISSGANNSLGIQLSGTYQVAGAKCICSLNKSVSPWISGSCGFGSESMRRVNININSKISFLPNFRLSTVTMPGKIEALDKCYVSLFTSDVTSQVLDSVRASVKSFCSTLDATISSMDFSGEVQQGVEKGFHKIAISKYGFLIVNPVSVHIGQLNYFKDSLRISIGLSCKPQLSSDSTTPPTPDTRIPVSISDNRDNVVAYVNAIYDYAFISRVLSDTLRNKVIEYKGRTYVVKGVTIKGLSHHQVEVKVEVSGTNKGSLYLRGTPVLDTARQRLTVPDVTSTVESKELELKIFKGIVKNKIKKSLNGNTYIDIGALVKSNQKLIDSMVNRSLGKNLSLSGKVNELKIIGLLPQRGSLQVQLYTRANLAILSNGNF